MRRRCPKLGGPVREPRKSRRGILDRRPLLLYEPYIPKRMSGNNERRVRSSSGRICTEQWYAPVCAVAGASPTQLHISEVCDPREGRGNATHAKGTQTKQPQSSRRGQRQATGDTPPDLKIYIGLDKNMLMVAPFAIEENLFKVVLINCVLYFSLTTGSSYKTKQIGRLK